MSGLFSKRTIEETRWDKIVGFLLVYIVSKMLSYLYNFGNFKLELFHASGLPWFMLAMFVFPLITHWLRNVKFVYVMVLSITFALIVGFDDSVTDFLAISRLFVFFPFYYLGYSVEAQQVTKITNKRWIKILSLFFLVAMAILTFCLGDKIYILRFLFTGRNPYNFLGEYSNFGVLLRLIGYGISTLISFAVIAITPNRTPVKFLARFGTRTLSVYFYHYTALYLLYGMLDIRSFFSNLPMGDSGYYIIPLAIVLSLVFSLRIFSIPLDFLMKLPTKALKSNKS